MCCGDRIKDHRFTTCSIDCSVYLTRYRVEGGLWASIKQADHGNRKGIRDAWPDELDRFIEIICSQDLTPEQFVES